MHEQKTPFKSPSQSLQLHTVLLLLSLPNTASTKASRVLSAQEKTLRGYDKPGWTSLDQQSRLRWSSNHSHVSSGPFVSPGDTGLWYLGHNEFPELLGPRSETPGKLPFSCGNRCLLPSENQVSSFPFISFNSHFYSFFAVLTSSLCAECTFLGERLGLKVLKASSWILVSCTTMGSFGNANALKEAASFSLKQFALY